MIAQRPLKPTNHSFYSFFEQPASQLFVYVTIQGLRNLPSNVLTG
jgi:hypothetical protein